MEFIYFIKHISSILTVLIHIEYYSTFCGKLSYLQTCPGIRISFFTVWPFLALDIGIFGSQFSCKCWFSTTVPTTLHFVPPYLSKTLYLVPGSKWPKVASVYSLIIDAVSSLCNWPLSAALLSSLAYQLAATTRYLGIRSARPTRGRELIRPGSPLICCPFI